MNSLISDVALDLGPFALDLEFADEIAMMAELTTAAQECAKCAWPVARARSWQPQSDALRGASEIVGSDDGRRLQAAWQGFARCPYQSRPYGSAALPGRLSFVTLSTPERTALFRVGI